MYQPNDADDPAMDNELPIGTHVIWAGDILDVNDQPFPQEMKRRLTVVGYGHSGWSYDYTIESQLTFMRYHVQKSEITLPDGTPIE